MRKPEFTRGDQVRLLLPRSPLLLVDGVAPTYEGWAYTCMYIGSTGDVHTIHVSEEALIPDKPPREK